MKKKQSKDKNKNEFSVHNGIAKQIAFVFGYKMN